MCEHCRESIAAIEHANPGFRANDLDQAEPLCRCQHVSVSEYSSGPVKDTEVLVRVLVAPQHMTGKRQPRAAALTDAERNGLSLLREHEATDEDIRKVAEGLVARARNHHGNKAGVFGVLRIHCGTVRNCVPECDDAPCYCVYDTALSELRPHTETFQRVAGVEDGIRELRRATLFSVLKTSFVSVGEFRGGLLLDLAPQQ
jgi:hypothetical protein